MKKAFIVAAALLGSVVFSNTSSALEARVIKDFSKEPNAVLFEKAMEVNIHEKEEITDDEAFALIKAAITPAMSEEMIDFANAGGMLDDYKNIIKTCIAEMQSGKLGECYQNHGEGENTLAFRSLSGMLGGVNFGAWANGMTLDGANANLDNCDPNGTVLTGCYEIKIKFNIEREQVVEEEIVPVVEEKVEEEQLQAPNTGFSGGVSALALVGFSLLGLATFFARKK